MNEKDVSSLADDSWSQISIPEWYSKNNRLDKIITEDRNEIE